MKTIRVLVCLTPVALAISALAQTNTFPSSGNVGIGTTNPTSLLDLVSNTAGFAYTGYRAYTGATHWYVGAGNSGVTIQDFGIGQSSVGSNPSLMIQNSTGNVGIGTTNPTQKLSVNGTIRAKEVIVDTGWSDYVFDKDYRLAPLAEVEQHIKTEKHLPGIPSAADVAAHGVSMGEMQAKLLEKIEEITLRQIEQEKKINSLSNENTTLRAENREMSLRLHALDDR